MRRNTLLNSGWRVGLVLACLMVVSSAFAQKKLDRGQTWDAVDDIRDAYADMLGDCRSEGRSGDIKKYLKCLEEEWQDEVASEFKSLKSDYGNAMEALKLASSGAGYLGAGLVELSSWRTKLNGVHSGAVVISGIEPGSAAEAAGFKLGDVIVAVAGSTSPSLRVVNRAISKAGAGKSLAFKVRRDGKEVELKATLGRLPDERVTVLIKVTSTLSRASVTASAGKLCDGRTLTTTPPMSFRKRSHRTYGSQESFTYNIEIGDLAGTLQHTTDGCDTTRLLKRINSRKKISSDSICSDRSCKWSPLVMLRDKDGVKEGKLRRVPIVDNKLFDGSLASLRLVLNSCASNFAFDVGATVGSGTTGSTGSSTGKTFDKKAAERKCNRLPPRIRKRCVQGIMMASRRAKPKVRVRSRSRSAKKSSKLSFEVYGPCYRGAMNVLEPAVNALMKSGGLGSLPNDHLTLLSKAINGVNADGFSAGEKALSAYLLKVYNARIAQILLATPDVHRIAPEKRAELTAKWLINQDRLLLADLKKLATAAEKMKEQRVVDRAALACTIEWEDNKDARTPSNAYCRKTCLKVAAAPLAYDKCWPACLQGKKGADYPSYKTALRFTFGKHSTTQLNKAAFLSSCNSLSSELKDRCVSQCTADLAKEIQRRWTVVEQEIAKPSTRMLKAGGVCGAMYSGCQLCKRETESKHKAAKGYAKALKTIVKLRAKSESLEEKQNKADTSAKEAAVGVKMAQNEQSISKAEAKAGKARLKIPLQCNLSWFVPEELGRGSDLMSKTRAGLAKTYEEKLDAFKEAYQSAESASIDESSKQDLQTAKDGVKEAKSTLKQAKKDAREEKKQEARAKRQTRKNAAACMKMCTAWGPCSNNPGFICGRRCGHHRVCPCCRSSRKWCKRQCY